MSGAPEFKPDEFIGLTVHDRIKKVTNRWASAGYRITRLTFPPGLFTALEHVEYPLLTGTDVGLALVLLGEKVPIFARFDEVKTVQIRFSKRNGTDVMALEMDLAPELLRRG